MIVTIAEVEVEGVTAIEDLEVMTEDPGTLFTCIALTLYLCKKKKKIKKSQSMQLSS